MAELISGQLSHFCQATLLYNKGRNLIYAFAALDSAGTADRNWFRSISGVTPTGQCSGVAADPGGIRRLGRQQPICDNNVMLRHLRREYPIAPGSYGISEGAMSWVRSSKCLN